MASKRACDGIESSARRRRVATRDSLAPIRTLFLAHYRMILTAMGQSLAMQLLAIHPPSTVMLDTIIAWIKASSVDIKACIAAELIKSDVSAFTTFVTEMPDAWHGHVAEGDTLPMHLLEIADGMSVEKRVVIVDILLTLTDASVLNAQSSTSGDTLLHYAVEYQEVRVVSSLLANKEVDMLFNNRGEHALFAFFQNPANPVVFAEIIRLFNCARQWRPTLFDPNAIVRDTTFFGELVRMPYYVLITAWLAALDCDMRVDGRAFVSTTKHYRESPELKRIVLAHDRSALYRAASKNDVESAQSILSAGAQPDHISILSTEMPMTYAIRKDNVDVMRTLFAYGASDTPPAPANSLIITACQLGSIGAVTLLLQRPATDVNKPCLDKGWTALGWACMRGFTKVVQLLLAHPSTNADLVDDSGYTPLNIACVHGHLDIVMLLCTSNIDLNARSNDGYVPLLSALNNEHAQVAQYLCQQQHLDVTVRTRKGWSAINIAAHFGMAEVVRLLLRHPKTDVSVASNDGWTPLNTACDSGHQTVVTLLLEHSMDIINVPNTDGYTPLVSAVRNKHRAIALQLLEIPAVDTTLVGERVRTALLFAAEHGYDDVAAKLIERRTRDVNMSPKGFPPPLIFALLSGDQNIAHIIMTHPGVDLTCCTKLGETVLFLAACKRLADVTRTLLMHCDTAFVNKPNDEGFTPLHGAVRCGNASIVEMLLKDARVDAQCPAASGNTPLHSAAVIGHVAIGQMLLAHGVDHRRVNADGKTALDIARAKTHRAFVRLFTNMKS